VNSGDSGSGREAVPRPFVGRADAMDPLVSALSESRGGRPALVVIEGAAGVGKTTLVKQFLAGEEPTRVIKAWGAEAEALERFSVVGQLLRRLRDASGDPTIDTEPRAGDEVTEVGARLLAALGGPPGVRVLVVDDAQWADVASLQALTFTLRRLDSDPVLTVVCTRTLAGNGDALGRLVEGNRGRVIHLGGLSAPEVRQLAMAYGVDLPAAAAQRLQAHTGGLPLHVSSLLRELDAPVLARAQGPLPAPRSFATLVLQRLAACSPETVALVSAAAVLGGRPRLSVAAAVAGIDDPVAPLDGAVAAQLLEHRRNPAGDEVRFVHDLVRAAVLDGLAPGRRVRLHRQAAACLGGVAALEHRAAAAVLPDAGLAVELAAAARLEAGSGGSEAAVHHFLEAARVSDDVDVARGFRLDALETLIFRGATAAAKELAADLQPEIGREPDRARVDYLQGHLALLDGRRGDAERLLMLAWERCDTGARPRLAALIAAQLALLCAVAGGAGRNSEAATWSARVTEFAGDDSSLASTAVATRLSSLVFSGRPEEALARALPQQATAEALAAGRFHEVAGRGLVRLWTDDLPGARSDLASVADPGRQSCPLRVRLFCMGYLAEVDYRAGRWDDCAATAELAASLAQDAGQMWLLGLLHGIAALPLARRGMWPAAGAHVAAAQAAGAAIGDVLSRAYPAMAAAAVAAARGDHDAALAATGVIAAMDPAHGALEPTVFLWCPERVEALVAKGRLDEAAALLDLAEPLARTRRRRSALAGLTRARGMLEAARGDAAAAASAFEAGADLVPGLGMPFEAGLMALAYGSHLRRSGQRRAAAGQLRTAVDTFVALAAAPYIERGQAELAACGLTPRRRTPARPTLTAREHAVARLVAEGLTNQEIAQRLFVSAKTVEYYLGNAFLKLGVRSRAQLVAQLAVSGSGHAQD
jgi:DNA-binding CsgD family transcriptional regulator